MVQVALPELSEVPGISHSHDNWNFTNLMNLVTPPSMLQVKSILILYKSTEARFFQGHRHLHCINYIFLHRFTPSQRFRSWMVMMVASSRCFTSQSLKPCRFSMLDTDTLSYWHCHKWLKTEHSVVSLQ